MKNGNGNAPVMLGNGNAVVEVMGNGNAPVMLGNGNAVVEAMGNGVVEISEL